jgi:4-amino-4-deoxychorismate lyase
MILINGDRKQHIEVTDRGLQYGDGLFETIEVIDSTPIFLDLHLQRLQHGCQRLNITCPSLELLTSETSQICQNTTRAVLKIIVTRGTGGRGYKPPEISNSTRIISLHPYPNYPIDFQSAGISAIFCQTRLGSSPALAGIKHLNRLEQILGRSEWNDESIQEGLMLDNQNFVIEGTMSNLFWIKDEQFFTSSLLESGVCGIIRGIIMDQLSTRKTPAITKRIQQQELLCADEVFVCNSIIGIWPLTRLASTTFSIGPHTRQIQSWLQQLKTQG